MIKADWPWHPRREHQAAPATAAAEAAMDRSEASELADLQMHWDEAYVIGMDGDIWCARFRGPVDELRAHTGQALRELIRTDYARRQQLRVTAERVSWAKPDNTDLSNVRGERMST
jgi:hypothetical protein